MCLGIVLIKVAIIGSGISALAAAHFLREWAEVVLFDKSRGVGGRMSTRRVDSYIFDHGAQYFTAREKPFKDFILPLIDQGLVSKWDANYVKIDGGRITDRQSWVNEEPRYISPCGINQIAKYLAQDFDIHLNTKIIRLLRQKKWVLFDEKNRRFDDFDWVISTVPSNQAVDFIPKNFKYHDLLSSVDMTGCISLGLGFRQKPPLEFDCAHVKNSTIGWIAKRFYQLGHNDFFAMMIHSSAKFAKMYSDSAPDEIIALLRAELSQLTGFGEGIADCENLQIWRYARSDDVVDEKVLLDYDLNLATCGDWLNGGRVEGGFMSAYCLIHTMKEGGM